MPEGAGQGGYAGVNSNHPKELSLQSSQSEILRYLQQKSREQRALYPRTKANIESMLKRPKLNALYLEDIFNINADEADVLIQLGMVKRAEPESLFDTKSVGQFYDAVSKYEEKPVETPQPIIQPEIPPTRSHPKEEKKAKKPTNGKTHPQPDLQNPFQKIKPQHNGKNQRHHYIEGDNDRGYKEKPEERTSLDRYFEDIGDLGLIAQNEEIALNRRIRSGDEWAFEKLVRSNLRYVVSVAKEYQGRGLPLEDLIGEGNLGLIYAAKRFDESIGVKFITYARWWIRQAILAALYGTGRNVRIPVNRHKHLHAIQSAIRKIEQETSQAFTFSRVYEIAEETGLTQRQIRDMLLASRRELSLDMAYGEDGEESLCSTIPDNSRPLPDEQLEQKELLEQVQDALDRIDDREAEVIDLYFGLTEDEPLTLEEIGKQFGLTKERIRQIRDGALNRLRQPQRIKNLEAVL